MRKIPGYTLIEQLYHGSSCSVFRAVSQHRAIGGGDSEKNESSVIVKVAEENGFSASRKERFEACVGYQMRFQNSLINPVLGVIEQGDCLALVTEDIGGGSLSEWLELHTKQISNGSEEGGRADLLSKMKWAIQIAEAIAVCHSQNVIHNDINPSNIIVNTKTQQLQLIDFDAAMDSEAESGQWVAGQHKTALAFAAPEQTGRLNRSIDYRSDYYGLGTTLYQLFSGVLPFEVEDVIELVHCQIARIPSPLMELNSKLPEALSLVVSKLMAKAPEDRYQNGHTIVDDLRRIYRSIEDGVQLPLEHLAQNDIPETLLISHKLYGREKEVGKLVECVRGGTAIVVKGAAGVGKTAVVQEVLQQSEVKNKLILRGKFEQYQHSPSEGLVQALSQAVDYILTLPPDVLLERKVKLRAALGGRKPIILALIPELQFLLDFDNKTQVEYVQTSELSVSLNERVKTEFNENNSLRLKLQLTAFIEWLANDQPVVFFLDDIHWCDHSSFELIETIFRLHHPGITIVLTCRDDELDKNHALYKLNQSTLNVESSTSRNLHFLNIGNLSVSSIEEMLFETFRSAPEKNQPFAQLIRDKTLGNPLFIREYLRAAFTQQALYFDRRIGGWAWNIEKLNLVAATGNVIDVLIDTLRRLPEQTQELLQWAACLGKRFDVALLSLVTEVEEECVEEALISATQYGLIYRGQFFSEYLMSSSEARSDLDAVLTAYKKGDFQFSHDRIQQAIHEQLEDGALAQRHNHIAQVLMKQGELTRAFNEAVLPHLVIALGSNTIRSRLLAEDIGKVFDYLMKGSAKSRVTRDSYSNLQYLSAALMLVEKFRKNDKNQLSDVLIRLAEVEYLEGQIIQARAHFSQYQEININKIKKAEGHYRQSMVESLGGEPRKIVEFGINALECLGVSFAPLGSAYSELIEKETKLFDSLSSEVPLSFVVQDPMLEEYECVLAQQIMERIVMFSPVIVGRDFSLYAALKSLNFMLSTGCTVASPALLASHSVNLMRQGKYQESWLMITEAMNLIEKHGLIESGCTKSYYGGLIARYFLSFDECIDIINEAEEENRMLGNDQFLWVNKLHRISLSFMKGNSLRRIKEESNDIVKFAEVYGNRIGGGLHYWRLIDQMIDPNAPDYFERQYFSEDDWHVCSNTRVHVFIQHFIALNLFWRNRYAELMEHINKIDNDMEEVSDLPIFDEYQFVKSIAVLHQMNGKDSDAIGKELEILDSAISHLKTISDLCPKNYEHHYLLVVAELERVTGRSSTVSSYYRASEVARKNGVLPIYSLAQELQGSYWKSKGRLDYAHLHFSNAVQGYSKWGCETKVQLMETVYGHSLSFNPASVGEVAQLPPSKGGDTPTSPERLMPGTVSTRSNRANSHTLDNISYLKVANAIAEEMDLNTLMLQIVRVVLENVGAERGYLLLKQNGNYRLHAQAESSSDRIDVVEMTNGIEEDVNTPLPHNVINYCVQTKKPVLLDDAQKDSRFSVDDYIRNQKTKSLICFPVIYKDNACAIFVLVNNAVSSVFTQQHLQFITTLAPQFAVSIGNALLYQQIVKLNDNLENTIGQRTEELKAANEELQAFSSSVSHDLKAPLRVISGLSVALKEDCADELPSEGIEYIQYVCDASERMKHIIEGLLMLSRSSQSTLQWDEVNLTHLVEEKVTWLRNLEPNRVVVTNIQENVIAKGDVQLLHQVIDNLVSNAWKYSNKNAQAKIEFGQTNTQRGQYSFYIRDNGAGFDAASAEDLFKPFRRFHAASEFEGTGVGLATVYRIVKRHGGDVWVESKPNQGATFYFTLSAGDTT